VVERELVLPVPAEELWQALTDPAALGSWFGTSVSWDLRPGGAAHFEGGEDGDRDGLIEEVEPARRLRFRWWPVGDDAAEGTSEVTYELVPLDEDGGAGTRLVVTERPAPAGPPAASASATARWTTWDGVLWSVWAGTTGAVGAGRR
jgi:uncharacterized protein YndB with AHSA1/START domain